MNEKTTLMSFRGISHFCIYIHTFYKLQKHIYDSEYTLILRILFYRAKGNGAPRLFSFSDTFTQRFQNKSPFFSWC